MAGDGGEWFYCYFKDDHFCILAKIKINYVDTDCTCIPKIENLCEIAWYVRLC